MANFTANVQTDLINYYQQTEANASFPGLEMGRFHYFNPTQSFTAYGVTIVTVLPGPVSGTVTDIFTYPGPPTIGLSPVSLPQIVNLAFSGLSIDYTVAVSFFGATTQTASLDALATMLSGTDTLTGSAFDDVLSGFAGADVIDGAGGIDTVSYATSLAGVNVSLAKGIGKGGDAAGDTLTSIENLAGSIFRDTLVGDSGDNALAGNGGNDTLIGGAGADTLDGGDGIDTVSYAGSPDFVFANLTTGNASGGDAQGDQFISIENLIGSSLGDELTGSVASNRIQGMEGDDIIFGMGGNDTLIGGNGSDDLSGNEGNDTLNGDAGTDYLYGGAGADRLNGGDGSDTLSGDAGADVLTGGSGVDIFVFRTPDGTVDSIRDWEDGDQIYINFTIDGIDLTNIVNGTTTRGLEGEGLFYNSANGRLYAFDSETDVLNHFATLANKPAVLDAGDFMFV